MPTQRFLILMACLSIAGALSAQSSTISGQVTDPTGEPGFHAVVTLLQNGAEIKSVTADDYGNFRFVGLDAGSYSVRASMGKDARTVGALYVKSGEMRDVYIEIYGNNRIRTIEMFSGSPYVPSNFSSTGAVFSTQPDDYRLLPNRIGLFWRGLP